MNAFKVEHLFKKRGGFELSDVSLCLPQGCIMGIIGENGAGKSTLMSLMTGAIKPDGGVVELLGKQNSDKSVMEDIGVVYSEPNFTGGVNIKQLDKIFSGIYRNWDSDCFNVYAERFDIPKNTKFKDLSRGNKMKASIAAALSHDAKLLLLDEATSGLDPVVRDDILDVLNELARDKGISIFISSHIVTDLERLCDYITFIHEGRIIMGGAKDEICEGYKCTQCSDSELALLDKDDIIGVRRGKYSNDVMMKCSGGRTTLEELFLYMVKYNDKGDK